jgi:uncharacterized membrane protein
MISRQVVVCVFYEPAGARAAIQALKEVGYGGDDISLITPDASAADGENDKSRTAREGAATGAAVGGLFGGLAGWLVGLGAFAIPGIGPVVAAGALAGAIGGVALGAGLGAIAGALVGMGVPEHEAKYYEQEVCGGRSLVAVRGQRLDKAEDILHRSGGYDAQHRAPAATTKR